MLEKQALEIEIKVKWAQRTDEPARKTVRFVPTSSTQDRVRRIKTKIEI